MDSVSFSFSANVIGVATAIVSLLGLFIGLYRSHLPSFKFKVLQDLLRETEGIYQSAVEEEQLPEDLSGDIRGQLEKLHREYYQHRLRVYGTTTLLQQYKEFFKGLSFAIGRTTRETEASRALLIRTVDAARLGRQAPMRERVVSYPNAGNPTIPPTSSIIPPIIPPPSPLPFSELPLPFPSSPLPSSRSPSSPPGTPFIAPFISPPPIIPGWIPSADVQVSPSPIIPEWIPSADVQIPPIQLETSSPLDQFTEIYIPDHVNTPQRSGPSQSTSTRSTSPYTNLSGDATTMVEDVHMSYFAEGPDYGPVLQPFLVKAANVQLMLNSLLTPPPPGDDGDRAHLIWDMLFPNGRCRRSDDTLSHRSWIRGRNEPATFPRVTHLRIISRAFPWIFDIRAQKKDIGITCGEVIEGIDDCLKRYVSRDETSNISRVQLDQVHQAYNYNRSTSDDVPGGMLGDGMRRCDWLGDQTLYGGIIRNDRFVQEYCGDILPCTVELKCMTRYRDAVEEDHEKRD